MNAKQIQLGSAAVIASLALASGADAQVNFFDSGARMGVQSWVEQEHDGSQFYWEEATDSSGGSLLDQFDAANDLFYDDGNGYVASVQSAGALAINPTIPDFNTPISGLTFSTSSSVSSSSQRFRDADGAGGGIWASFTIQVTEEVNWSFGGDLTMTIDDRTNVSQADAGWYMQIVSAFFGGTNHFEDHGHLHEDVGTLTDTVALSGTLAPDFYNINLIAATGAIFRDDLPGSFTGSFLWENGYMNFTPVPSPGAASLLGLALFGGAARRRR